MQERANGLEAWYGRWHLGGQRVNRRLGLVKRLARVIRPAYIPVWLNTPIPLLDHDRPIERIAAGDYRAVARLISGLEGCGTA